MDFRLSDETLEWQQYCRKFAREVVRPAAPQHDRDESVPYEVMQRGLRVEARRPRLDPVAADRPRGPQGRHLRRGDPLGLRRHRARDLGLDALRRRHRLVGHARADRPLDPRGDRHARTTPRSGPTPSPSRPAGSDVKSLRTTAKRDGDDWILNGTKTFISNGGIADVTVVVATVDPDLGHRGQASFIVTGDNPGLKLGHKESKLGIRASQTAEIVLEDCRVPGDAPAGRRGEAAAQARARPLGPELQAPPARSRRSRSRARRSGASALGIAQAAYEWTLEYLHGPHRGRPAAASGAAHPAGARRRRDRDRGGPPARVARGLDGAQRRPDDRRPGLDVEAEGRRRRDVGDDRR